MLTGLACSLRDPTPPDVPAREEIIALLDRYDAAIRTSDWKTVEECFLPTAVITRYERTGGGVKLEEFTRERWVIGLQDLIRLMAWSQARNVERIQYEAEGTLVTSTLQDRFLGRDGLVQITTKEIAGIVSHRGRLRFGSLVVEIANETTLPSI